MKQTQLWIAVVLMFVLTAGTVFAQKEVDRTNAKDGEKAIDTRIDNMGYWKQKAAEGIIPIQQPVPIPPAEYTGSLIEAKSVKSKDGKDDSVDVPVTELTNVTESENSVFVDPSDNEKILNSNNSTGWNGGYAWV